MIAAIKRWWKQRTCEHYWRPAGIRFSPFRICDYCERTEQVTEEAFYAQFGMHFTQWVNQINEAIRRAGSAAAR